MNLTEALQHEQHTPTRPCKLGRIRNLLTTDDRTALDTALAHGTDLTKVHRALKTLGHQMAYATVNRHARGDCPCNG